MAGKVDHDPFGKIEFCAERTVVEVPSLVQASGRPGLPLLFCARILAEE